MPILPHALTGKIFIHKFLSCVNDYMEDVAIFTALVKFIPPNISAIQKLLGYMVLSRVYNRRERESILLCILLCKRIADN